MQECDNCWITILPSEVHTIDTMTLCEDCCRDIDSRGCKKCNPQNVNP